MASRYIITGVQIGILLGHLNVVNDPNLPEPLRKEIVEESLSLLKEITCRQYIGDSTGNLYNDAIGILNHYTFKKPTT